MIINWWTREIEQKCLHPGNNEEFKLQTLEFFFPSIVSAMYMEGNIGVYDIAILGFFFFSGISVILILIYGYRGIAVSSSPAVCCFLSVFDSIHFFFFIGIR